MPKQSLPDSTKGLAGPFDGALETSYMTPLDPLRWLTAWQNLSLPSQVIHWAVTDQGPDGSARFHTTTEFTGQTTADLPRAAVYRLICLYLLGHLNEKSLIGATEWLAEIYTGQVAQSKYVPVTAKLRTLPVSGVDRVERVPFAFHDE
jgi:hypothetical protein